jgi:uncharacterized protein (TIGR03067 family)
MSGSAIAKLSLRTAMFVVLLAALGISLAIQGRMLAVQGQRISTLETTARRLEVQNRQVANVIIQDQQARIGEASDLRREIEAIRPVSATVSDPKGLPSASTPSGEWVQETVERGGNLINSGVRAAKIHLFVDGNAFRSEEDGKVVSRWTITFDPLKTPAEFDATIEHGKFQGQLYRGIYRIEGDRWTYVFGLPGSERPSKFEASPGSTTTRVVARRKGTH